VRLMNRIESYRAVEGMLPPALWGRVGERGT
jgi:hypothetical protein